MKCSHCHEQVDLEWKYCSHCGHTLVDERIIYLFLKALRTKKIAYTLLIFEIAFIGMLSYLMVDSSKQLQEKNKKIQQLINSKKDITVQWEASEKIFPLSYVAGNQKLVEFKVSSEHYAKLKAEVYAKGITSTEAKIIDIKPGGNIFSLGPNITEEGYRKLTDSTKSTVAIKVTLLEDQPREIINDTKEVTFFSTSDIVWNDQGENNSKYIVRLINKDTAEIKNLVRLAADHMKEVGGETNAMVGELGDKEEIARQLEAIFLAMAQDYQIRYIMAPYSYDSTQIQKVKSPTEVLATKSGLCIELSLLMAAALEHIGLNPVIVVTSGHAWPGVELDGAKNEYAFIETTQLEKSAEEVIKIGEKNWESVRSDPSAYRLLKVAQLRSEGLLPIKY